MSDISDMHVLAQVCVIMLIIGMESYMNGAINVAVTFQNICCEKAAYNCAWTKLFCLYIYREREK